MISATELERVEDAIRNAIATDVDLLSTASEYIIRSGGKRLRPQIVILAYQAAGGSDVSTVVPLAAAVELLHTASLIHDDINDRSELRRGQLTVNARWGDSFALLIGDFVFVRLLHLLAQFDARAIQVLAKCCTAIVEGETLQVIHLGNVHMSEETYLDIVARKTALLFSACSELGSLAAGASERQIAALREYGFNLGVAFQIQDDTLDLVGRASELGKPVAVDLQQGKMSLATIFALQESDPAREALLSGSKMQATDLLRDIGAIEHAVRRGREYTEQAKQALAIIPDSGAKSELLRLADFVITRDQ